MFRILWLKIRTKFFFKIYNNLTNYIWDYVNYDKNQAYQLVISYVKGFKFEIVNTHNALDNMDYHFNSYSYLRNIKEVKQYMKFEGLII